MASAMVSGLQDFMGPRSRYLAVWWWRVEGGEPDEDGDGDGACDELEVDDAAAAAAAFWFQHFCHMLCSWYW